MLLLIVALEGLEDATFGHLRWRSLSHRHLGSAQPKDPHKPRPKITCDLVRLL